MSTFQYLTGRMRPEFYPRGSTLSKVEPSCDRALRGKRLRKKSKSKAFKTGSGADSINVKFPSSSSWSICASGSQSQANLVLTLQIPGLCSKAEMYFEFERRNHRKKKEKTLNFAGIRAMELVLLARK